jgi:hypothetical protein
MQVNEALPSVCPMEAVELLAKYKSIREEGGKLLGES